MTKHHQNSALRQQQSHCFLWWAVLDGAGLASPVWLLPGAEVGQLGWLHLCMVLGLLCVSEPGLVWLPLSMVASGSWTASVVAQGFKGLSSREQTPQHLL